MSCPIYHFIFILFNFLIFFNADLIASPVEYGSFYSEKFIYMPHSFLANSFAYQQPDMKTASLILSEKDNPSSNKCNIMPNIDDGDDDDDGDGDGDENSRSFVFCNFNKHLKFDPDLFTHWLKTLQTVKNSYLCLLQNPEESKEFLTEFVKDYSPNLVKKIGYLPFVNNPYENQQRNTRFCHVILDTTIYNGHTTAADALWGGVPVVTRGDGVDMGSRVGASILTALNLTELIGTNQQNYNDIALKLALDKDYYAEIRSKLIQANHAETPMNPFWDLQRYVRNLESGFESVWDNFINSGVIEHVYVVDKGSSNTTVEESGTYRAIVDDVEDSETAPKIQKSNAEKEKEIEKEESKTARKQSSAAAAQKRRERQLSTKKKKTVKKNQRANRKRKRKNGRSRQRSSTEEL